MADDVVYVANRTAFSGTETAAIQAALGGGAAAAVTATAAVTTIVRPPTRPIPIRILTWTPVAQLYQDKTIERRIAEFGRVLDDNPHSDIFMAPECCFCRWGPKPGGGTDVVMKPLSFAEGQLVYEGVKRVSERHPKTLIIPGSVIAYEPTSANAVNYTFALLDGEPVRDSRGQIVYAKRSTGAEASQRLLTWTSGDRGGFDFDFHGLSCKLEICADHNNVPVTSNLDLLLIVGHGFGQPTLPAMLTGWCVMADSALGVGAQAFKTGQARQLATKDPFTFDLTIDVPMSGADIAREAYTALKSDGKVLSIIDAYLKQE
ncbi:MAG: hypothetical protein HYX47_02060 [Burkholderiales bacterium]|nr:hypothetical protein [Burkholderiales bacterium]